MLVTRNTILSRAVAIGLTAVMIACGLPLQAHAAGDLGAAQATQAAQSTQSAQPTQTSQSARSGLTAQKTHYQFGPIQWNSTYSYGDLLNDTYYYSDDWFSKDPSLRNDELALMSSQLTAATSRKGDLLPGNEFLKSIGCYDTGFHASPAGDINTGDYAWGLKKLADGTTLVVVAFETFSNDALSRTEGWQQCFRINEDKAADPAGEHYGVAKAAESTIPSILDLAGSGPVKVWITGDSRAGALANLVAAKLPEKLGANNKGIYAYTFDIPCTVEPADDVDKERIVKDFAYIHNYSWSDDLVTKLLPWNMNWYGNTYILKGGVDEAVLNELQTLGSKEASANLQGNGEELTDWLTGLFASQVPERKDYSRERRDVFTDASEQPHDITYSYQDSTMKLIATLFNGTLSGLPFDEIMQRLTPAVIGQAMALPDQYAAAIRMERAGQDASLMYWSTTAQLRQILQELTQKEDLLGTPEEVHALMRLLAPILIDVPDDPEQSASIQPIMTIAQSANDIIFSHHLDTVIARMKLLAPDIQPPVTVQLSKDSYTYSGKVVTPKVTVLDHNGEVIDPSEYEVNYEDGRKDVGSYNVAIYFLKGTIEQTVVFRIVPKGTTLKKVSSATKAVNVTWKKQPAKMSASRINGYQIQVATNKKFTKNKKTVTVKKYIKTATKVKGLKAKKKYYVRVRTYKTTGGQTYYSNWSKPRTVKTK